jgi:ribulose-phosphate 3-epimerase
LGGIDIRGKMEPLIVPAVIARDQEELDRIIHRVKGKVKRVQLDFMDGEFVEGTSLDFDFRVPEGLEYEAHLMVKNPLEWVDRIADKVHIAIMHVKTLEDIGAAIEHAKEKGLKVSLALNPETGLEKVLPYLDDIYSVLVMTVNPGTYCVDFIPETLDKVRKLRETDPSIPIEVDGCENPKNARLAKEAGATIFASGSFIHKSDDPGRAIKEMYEAVE